ncbi:allophanate hydrolase [Thalassotalea insulae]|uniref:Allophanate hydrolase n=1 Tax=Thalassotalea insulae TaxID=2056778 RepID=A0ABQ6GQX0_9GAMM|nr:biotin-dependent carboxyltransferase family protein [Thalassotalea insulae]GLX78029.1 allophanate hydrolase [Thalassotalea insulae]
MSTLTITQLKGSATLQDLGRNEAQHLGFSASGAADEYSYCLANQLLANPKNTPALEITLGQITLTTDTSCTFVLTGADCRAQIGVAKNEAISNNQGITNNKRYQLNAGETLTLDTPKQQLHTYLAVAGGFQCKQWLNSASQACNELLLGFAEPVITRGKQLTFANSKVRAEKNLSHRKRLPWHFHQPGHLTLRFLPSQLWLNLTELKQAQFIKQHYHISAQSNRMGYRLKGSALELGEHSSNLSKPVCYGTIQCPSDGQPIVLMKDRQTIGGYPVLGNVIQTDLFRLSQKRPGETVSFLPVTLMQAQAQLFAFQQRF